MANKERTKGIESAAGFRQGISANHNLLSHLSMGVPDCGTWSAEPKAINY